MNVREQTEVFELTTMSPRASLSIRTRGRERPEEPCDIRTEYQRDRDRIIHCNAFRRLKHKTQVFLDPVGDHYRTRLTHTLEVSQIARTISRALRLNEDLTEAIALGHDLGHTPFGHSGEDALSILCPHGFKHYLQSVRVVEIIERDGQGLNLTYEVKNGIVCHTNAVADTLEGVVVKLSDKIAYINHDIEDAIRAGVIGSSDLPRDAIGVLGRTKSARITTLVRSIVENSREEIMMAKDVQSAHDILREFMFANVYTNPTAKGEESKAKDIICFLYEYYCKNAHKLPGLYKQIAEREGIDRAVCDYVAGMTDSFAINAYTDICIPKGWSKYQ